MSRTLTTFPRPTARAGYVALIVLVTVSQYYALYVQGSVSPAIIDDFDMSLRYYVMVSVIGNAVGAIASLAAGLADRWGRVNLVLGGLLATSLLILFGLPNAGSRAAYLVLFALVSVTEGAVLTITPALMRDFSVQRSRGAAMGIWAFGPVCGSLVVSTVASHTLPSHPDWRFQFWVCGSVGLAVFAVAAVGLRDLDAPLRAQVRRSSREERLIAARLAAGAEPAAPVLGLRVMLTPRIVLPALAYAIFLLFYFSRIAFFVLYLTTNYGYSSARANALENWFWGANAVALIVFGLIADRVGVRKPFIVAGTLICVSGVIGWTIVATHRDTGYYTFAALLLLCAVGGGMASANWLAAFSEAVEQRSPALVATGMAVWGWLVRATVAAALLSVTFLVGAAGTLVDHGARVKAITTQYAPELQTLAAIRPATLAALHRTPVEPAARVAAVTEIAGTLHLPPAVAARRLAATTRVPADDLAYLQKHGADVKRAVADGPHQWQRWWWVCVAGQLLFVPATWLLGGRWSRRKARADAQAVERQVDAELRELVGATG